MYSHGTDTSQQHHNSNTSLGHSTRSASWLGIPVWSHYGLGLAPALSAYK